MPDTPNRSLNHLRVDRFFEARDYRPPARPFPRKIPKRNRATHGAVLWHEWQPVVEDFRVAEGTLEYTEAIKEKGLVIELELAPNTQLTPDAFEKKKYGLQLLIVRRDKRHVPPLPDAPTGTRAKTETIERQIWFIPDGQIAQFEHLLQVYAGMTAGTAAATVVACIERIGPAAFEQLWTDSIPAPAQDEVVWFEMWLRAPTKERGAIILKQFTSEAARLGLRVGDARLLLRDYTVVMARGTRAQLEKSTALLACISEIRAGRDFAEFIQNLPVVEQAEWGRHLLERIDQIDDNVAICILDTGVNRGHPLLQSFIAETDTRSIKSEWGTEDHYGYSTIQQRGHGTPIAGIALLADVAKAVDSTDRFRPPAVIESTKIIPPGHDTATERHASAFTEQGVYLTEANRPNRSRVWCLATSWPGPNDGRPSAWSAVLDRMAAGEDREDGVRRLFVVAGGNVPEDQWLNYPQSNRDNACHIPAQAWNALIVGAYTQKREPLTSPTAGHEIAQDGALSPMSATTASWGEAMWPYRPDIVFEGGNANLPPGAEGPDMPPELLPMSLAADFRATWFTYFGATSAAAPVASHFAARLMRAYPEYWPETVRGLMVHSARWTHAMEAAVPTSLKKRKAVKDLLRTVGYGVPSLTLAEASAPHRVTLVAQSELQPFQQAGSKVMPHQMHIFNLPWPKQELLKLGENFFGGADTVRLRVTLSYFIQPNPGDRGYSSAYRYSSCQLRFKTTQPGQTLDELVDTINSEVAADEVENGDENEDTPTGRIDPSKGWKLGVKARTRGSLHSDWWKGSASDLIDMRHLVVYPITGWWRSRPSVNAGNSKLRYALLVSLEANDSTVDLYTEISTQIMVPVDISGGS